MNENKTERFGFWTLIKRLFRITGTERGFWELKEIKQQLIIAGIVIFLAMQVFFAYLFADQFGLINPKLNAKYDKNIAVLTIDQQITDKYVNKIIETLEEVRKRKEQFPHLLVLMASGGGSPTGSAELAHYFEDLEQDMNTTLYVESIAASGAYYISAAFKHKQGDRLSGIIAGENSILGSIGIYMENLTYGDAARKLGVDHKYVVLGKYKVPVSPWEELNPENEHYLKSNLLQPVLDNFVNYVARGRGLSRAELEPYLNGKVFVASEVVGPLADRISSLAEIKREIKQKVKAIDPEDSVGFVGVNLKQRKQSLFNVTLNIDGLKVDGINPLAAEANTYKLK